MIQSHIFVTALFITLASRLEDSTSLSGSRFILFHSFESLYDKIAIICRLPNWLHSFLNKKEENSLTNFQTQSRNEKKIDLTFFAVFFFRFLVSWFCLFFFYFDNFWNVMYLFKYIFEWNLFAHYTVLQLFCLSAPQILTMLFCSTHVVVTESKRILQTWFVFDFDWFLKFGETIDYLKKKPFLSQQVRMRIVIEEKEQNN